MEGFVNYEVYEIVESLLNHKLIPAVNSNNFKKVCRVLSSHSKWWNHPEIKSNHYYSLKYNLLKITNCDKKASKFFIEFLKINNEDNNDSEEQLKVAVLQGDLEKAESLLKIGSRLKLGPVEWLSCRPENWNWDPKDLPAACLFCRWNLKNRKKMLQLLLEYGLDTSVQNERGINLLHVFVVHFVRKDDEDAAEIAETLINSGIPFDASDRSGRSPLYWSLFSGANNMNLVSFLIEKGSDVNKKNRSECPLHCAVKTENYDIDIVKLLLSKGAEVNVDDKDGWAPLHHACYHHKKPLISLLLQNGADISFVTKKGDIFSLILSNTDLWKTYGQCVRFTVQEFLKLNFKNLTNFKKSINVIQAFSTAREHYDMCISELDRMENTKFIDYSSFYSILTMSTNTKKFAKLLKNAGLEKKFKAHVRRFPIFQDDLMAVFEKAIQVRDETAAIQSRLKSVFGDFFPDIVIEILGENLTVEDLPLQ